MNMEEKKTLRMKTKSSSLYSKNSANPAIEVRTSANSNAALKTIFDCRVNMKYKRKKNYAIYPTLTAVNYQIYIQFPLLF